MSRKLITIIVSIVAVLAMATTVFAIAAPRMNRGNAPVAAGVGGCNNFDLMLDENGDIVSKDVFEANLEKAIADGIIKAEDKEFFVEMYDACTSEDAQTGACPMMGGRGAMGGCGGRMFGGN